MHLNGGGDNKEYTQNFGGETHFEGATFKTKEMGNNIK
jgi:hypothetical protein